MLRSCSQGSSKSECVYIPSCDVYARGTWRSVCKWVVAFSMWQRHVTGRGTQIWLSACSAFCWPFGYRVLAIFGERMPLVSTVYVKRLTSAISVGTVLQFCLASHFSLVKCDTHQNKDGWQPCLPSTASVHWLTSAISRRQGALGCCAACLTGLHLLYVFNECINPVTQHLKHHL